MIGFAFVIVVAAGAAIGGLGLAHECIIAPRGRAPSGATASCTIPAMLQTKPSQSAARGSDAAPAVDRRRKFHPDVTVAAVVADGDGRFLIVEERVRGALVLNQPAGHLERGETLVEAAVRETLEESAWDVAPEAFLGTYQWTAPDGAHFLRFAFAARALQHHPRRPLDRGIVGAHWLARDELLARGPQLRSPLVLTAIDDYLQGVRLPLDAVRWIG